MTSQRCILHPMLLIPFVENSFKHGAIIDGCLAIMIAVKRNSEMLFFEVENSVLEKTNDSTGIGLENIKKAIRNVISKCIYFRNK